MSKTTSPIIDIRHVTKRFPGVVALDDVSFDVLPGELHAVCGENGAGKSTLMKILSGVLLDYEGEVAVRGDVVSFGGTRDAEAAGISIIHQELNLVEELSAAANIFLGREKRSRLGLLDDRAMEREAAGLLDQLECDIHPSTPVRELRVGDQQLVEIAKALSLNSDILIMDEPTSALTESEVERLYRVIDRLQERNVTILYISHKMDEVFRLSDRITVLRDGRHVQTLNRADTNAREVTHLMVGREIEEVSFADNRQAGEPILEVERLYLPWPEHARDWRLEDVSFTLRRGEVLGVAGLMGAGRTELLECLFGASDEPPQGTIRLEGREVAFSHPSQAKAAGIAMVTEDRKRLGLFAQMSVRENITICTLNEAATGGMVRGAAERRQAEESITQLGVKTAGSEAAITSLSGGNQQKCIIARWLRTNPKVLLLDDPTRGVDVGAKAELYKVIDGLCREGLGIIVTSSELPELITLCDRMLVLCEGRLTGELQRDEFTEQRIMELATQTEPVSA
ncbi:sugar ABC transporter ATP-binding protein [Maioricimonas sp. JC845]|uniref:sugar ABC transporter ATP-binding protein n=1 Tax=Maioricimonas sp. JC845 TaxID=3232138 RepID=UPI003459567B